MSVFRVVICDLVRGNSNIVGSYGMFIYVKCAFSFSVQHLKATDTNIQVRVVYLFKGTFFFLRKTPF
jgi:hypothetical protein